MDKVAERFELTPSQTGMAGLHEFYEGTSVATLCGVVIYEDKVDAEIFDEAVRTVIRRNEAIRLRIIREDGRYFQYISDEVDDKIDHLTMDSIDEIRSFGEREGLTVFDTDGSRMYHFTVLDLPDRTGLMICMSHMIADSWAYSIIVREIYGTYKALSGGVESTGDIRRYTDYIDRAAGYMTSSVRSEDIKFWEERYRDGLSTGSVGHAQDEEYSPRSKRYSTDISGEVSAAVRKFILEEHSSVSVVFEAAALIYLSRTSNVDRNVTIGTPVLGRSGVAEKATVGMFMSTIPVSVDIDPGESARSLCAKLSKTHRSLFRHSRLSHEEIARSIRSSSGYSGRLYDVLVNYQNSTTDVPSQTIWFSSGFTEVPLAIHIDDRDGNDRYTILLDHQLECFPDEREIALLAKRIEHIIGQMVTTPDIAVSDISLMPSEETSFLLESCNDTKAAYPKEKCIHEAFSEYASEHLSMTALRFRGEEYSYGDLDRMSDALALALIDRGIGRGKVVPLISKRRPYLIVAMLAVLKTGAAYMPVSPDYPEGRIELMIDTVNADLVLTCGYRCDYKEQIDLSTFDYSSCGVLSPVKVDPSDMSYVIFTSGSTGQPKATSVTHGNVVNYCSDNRFNMCGSILRSGTGTILSVTNLIFDIFVTESILALLNGIVIMLADDDQVMSGNALAEMISTGGPYSIQTTPTKMRSYLLDRKFRESISNIDTIALGGEGLPLALVEELRKYTDAKIYNVYGPAETTVWSSLAPIEGDDITVGKPIANTQIYILDENLQLCPVGIAGEIVISGDGVGKGYLNAQELTAERFIPDPYREGQIMYRTGDVGYMRADGNIVFCGRRDNQIKLRGLRIELGEIEFAIGKQDGVELAAAVCRKDRSGEPFIVGFYTSDGSIGEAEIKERLANELPSYMVPKIIRRIDEMPVTPSGKIDRKALPQVDITKADERDHVPPTNDAERILCDIVASVLKIERVGIEDDLFEIGCDSFAAMEIVSSAADKGIGLTVKRLYDARTIRAICASSDDSSASVDEDIDYSLYPLERTPEDLKIFKVISDKLHEDLGLNVIGVADLDMSRRYIICPDHETMLDPLIVWSSLQGLIDINDACTIAAAEFLRAGDLSRRIFRITGGIPLDRSGDFEPALRRAGAVLAGDKKYLLIHPEGTRSRTGELGEFKRGAAVLSIAAGISILPVSIHGAGEVFPIDRELTDLNDISKFSGKTLQVTFGQPIDPEGKNADELTAILRDAVLRLRSL